MTQSTDEILTCVNNPKFANLHFKQRDILYEARNDDKMFAKLANDLFHNEDIIDELQEYVIAETPYRSMFCKKTKNKK